MICQLYNSSTNFFYWVFGSTHRKMVSEVDFAPAALLITIFIVFIVLFSWWFIPSARIVRRLSKMKFTCNLNPTTER